MRSTIGDRLSGMIFLSVPLLALWALSSSWSSSQAWDLVSLAVSATGVAGEASLNDSTTIAFTEPVSDLSDWTYTANPMSPVGKTSFSRRLLSTTQPGHHATPAGPNPRVPWLTTPASLGNQGPSNFALMVPANVQQRPTGLLVSGNPQNYATPNTRTTPASGVASPDLIATQNLSLLQNVAALQSARSFAFQPITSNSSGSTTKKLSRGNGSGR